MKGIRVKPASWAASKLFRSSVPSGYKAAVSASLSFTRMTETLRSGRSMGKIGLICPDSPPSTIDKASMAETRGAEETLKNGLGHVAKRSATEVNSMLGHSIKSARMVFEKRVASGSTVPVEFIVQRVERSGVGAFATPIPGSLKRDEEVPRTKPRLS